MNMHVRTESKFKVGDRVKFRDDYGSDSAGKEAVVIDVPPSSWGIQVRQTDNGSVSTESTSSLVRSAPTTIADIVAKHSGKAIVCLIENGQPKPSSLPFVHSSAALAAAEANRLAGVHKGQEFGVYECVDVKKVERVYEHEWQRLAAGGERVAACKALRSLAGVSLAAAVKAVDAVRDAA
ncbi:hypothetical protein LB521_27945 [Mesorhizobium sp. BR-1-1-8]|uniref:hypothetical protein n=1 Tax=Mesorhizobium sp. BR-1-1-8 TaxID=2876659 RepID=UPI001CCE3232|nr:hypothetical protein [Mesorhizobium sp. BR-1-1-8]MBZ9984971.1 hypothetical protein [Mesorhizobium sp. BR-1-1-8]